MDSRDTPASPDSSNQPSTRKPYEKPQLQVYGNLAEIAKTILGTKTNDGAAHPNRHFTS
jgi:hypothetical protein